MDEQADFLSLHSLPPPLPLWERNRQASRTPIRESRRLRRTTRSSPRPRHSPSRRPRILRLHRKRRLRRVRRSKHRRCSPSDANLAPVGNTKYAAMSGDGTDDGIVQVAPPLQNPRRRRSAYTLPIPMAILCILLRWALASLGEGTSIRVELIGDLSSSLQREGRAVSQPRGFGCRMQGGQVLIPAGSEIDGTVVDVSTGHFGGHGSHDVASGKSDFAEWRKLSAPCSRDGCAGLQHTGRRRGSDQPGFAAKSGMALNMAA